ncbi:unnamed protein product [Pylaiella littoralis]
MAKPMPRFVKIIQNCATLTGHYQEWHARYDEICELVVQQRDKPSSGSSSSSGGSSSSSDNNSDDEQTTKSSKKKKADGAKVLCTACKPHAESRYHCPLCEIVHKVDCDLCVAPNPKASMTDLKYRPCLVCPPGDSGGGKRPATDSGSSAPKKQKKQADKTIPSGGQEDTGVETSQSRNVMVHDKVLFDGTRARKFDMGEAIDTSKQPKLIIVDITQEIWLLQRNDASKKELSRFLDACLASLHDQGTIAMGVPRP